MTAARRLTALTALLVPVSAAVDLGCRTRKTALAVKANPDLAAAWGATRPTDKAKRVPAAERCGRTPREILAAYIAARPALARAPEVRLTLTYPAPRKARPRKAAPKGWDVVDTAAV